MNASDERKLESIRTKVKQFARTAPSPGTTFKVIFLDEADALFRCPRRATQNYGAEYERPVDSYYLATYSIQDYRANSVSRCAVFRFRPLAEDQVLEMVKSVAVNEDINLDEDAAEAIAHVSLGDLRKAITSLQVAASLNPNVTRDLVYETTATAPPEVHSYILTCKEDGFQPARRRLKGLLDKFGLAGTGFGQPDAPRVRYGDFP